MVVSPVASPVLRREAQPQGEINARMLPVVRGGAMRARMKPRPEERGEKTGSGHRVSRCVETPGAASAELTGGPAMTGGIAISHSNHLPQSFRTEPTPPYTRYPRPCLTIR